MGGYWVVKTVRSGKVVERTMYYAGERRPRSPKAAASTAEKKQRNTVQAIRQLARGINCNFGAGDILLTLDYAAEPDSVEAAERECALFWRRLGHALGGKLRGYWIVADKDGDGNAVRLHHHLVIGGEGIELQWQDGQLISLRAGGREIAEIWGRGGVDAERLYSHNDYSGLAAYLVRQAAGGKGRQKWHASRGLKKPVVESVRVVDRPRPLRAPGGADVKEVGAYDEGSGTHYIRYIRKEREKIGGHREDKKPDGV